ncbi:MAG: hypothetical protein HOC82_12460 [Bacteroidetes bacterium]|jgi:hypothetical protein|nr:hypothetical protein [Bacteroidota bacterium]
MSKATDDAAKIIVQGKSLVVTVLLIIFLGSFGLFYATVRGGLFMTIGYPLITFFIWKEYYASLQNTHFVDAATLTTMGFMIYTPLILWYVISLSWGIVAVNKYNSDLLNEKKT